MPALPLIPYGYARLYATDAEAYPDDLGWAYYCVLDRDFRYFSATTVTDCGQAVPSAVRIELAQLRKSGDNGGGSSKSCVIPRPRLVPQNTDLDDWDQDFGSWQEVTPYGAAEAAPAKQHLHQYDATEDLWQLTSQWSLPENPAFCVALKPSGGALAGYDEAASPSYVSVTWGGDWSILLRKGRPGLLLRSGVAVAELSASWQWTDRGDQAEWIFLTILHLRGGIAIREEYSESWQWYALPCAEGDITAAAAPLVVAGRGCQCLFGLYQVVGSNATITSPEYPMDRTRAGAATLELKTGDYREPGGSSVALTEIATADDQQVQFKADLTMANATPAGAPWAFYSFPEIYACQVRFDPAFTAGTGAAPAEAWANAIRSIRVFLPEDLANSQAEIEIRWDSNDLGAVTGNLIWRRYDIILGWIMDDWDGVWPVDAAYLSLYNVFTGYATGFQTEEKPGRGLVDLRVSLEGMTTRLKRADVDDSWATLDGWDAEDAALYVLWKCGLPSTRGSFANVAGMTLSKGEAEEPCWRPQLGQKAYDVLKRIADHCRQEILETVAGVIGFVEYNYASATLHTIPSYTQARMIDYERDYQAMKTGVIVRGRDADGEAIAGWGINFESERLPAQPYFRGWRELETVDDATLQTQAQLLGVAHDRYPQAVRPRLLPNILMTGWVGTTSGAVLALSRRDTVQFTTGVLGGIANVDSLLVKQLTFEWRPQRPQCTTQLQCENITAALS